jgi:hypothetical protein
VLVGQVHQRARERLRSSVVAATTSTGIAFWEDLHGLVDGGALFLGNDVGMLMVAKLRVTPDDVAPRLSYKTRGTGVVSRELVQHSARERRRNAIFHARARQLTP